MSGEILVGSDLEVFVMEAQTHQPVSAIGLVGGTKEDPRKTEHGWVQEDNVLAEVNVTPSSTSEEFDHNLRGVVGDLQEILGDRYYLSFTSSAEFEVKELSHPLALIAGCTPDFDAWNKCKNFPPDLSATSLRTAGGHIHLSWDVEGEDVWYRNYTVKAMDFYIGLPSLLLDEDDRRRSLYGKAGAHRLKSYGVEWRTASNFWARTPTLTQWAFNNSLEAIENRERFKSSDMSYVMDVINNGDKEKAHSIIKSEGIRMP